MINGTDQQQVDPGGGGADRITDLADDVLHIILARLPTTAEAARTSVLSRRWRRVWTGVPALSFRYGEAPTSSTAQLQDELNRIDAVLSVQAPTTKTLERLEIAVPYGVVPDARVARWLRFAARRLNGELRLALPSSMRWRDEAAAAAAAIPLCERVTFMRWREESKEAAIPLCEGVTSMSLCLERTLRFPVHSAAGAFTALAALELRKCCVDGGELESILSFRCPSLKKLALKDVTVATLQPPAGDDRGRGLCICSLSLEHLKITYIYISLNGLVHISFNGLLQVATPELQSFSVNVRCDLQIIAPKLSELHWNRSSYDPRRHRLGEVAVARHLRRLKVGANTPAVAIMRRFHTVHELKLVVYIAAGPYNYGRFLEKINHLAKCEILVLKYRVAKHVFKATMINILSKCAGVRKLVIDYPIHFTVSAF
nr:unnamed protein product [Digitaria exilis]